MEGKHQNSDEFEYEGNDEDDKLWCFCGQPTFGEMIACENENCASKWFHYHCVGILKAPQGVWYCPDCLQIPGLKK